MGKYHNTSYLLPCPSNMYVFQHLPQLHLLSYCDLMVTLGGMNSIAECIEKEVPMLVCPLSLKSDQLGNSAPGGLSRFGIESAYQMGLFAEDREENNPNIR